MRLFTRATHAAVAGDQHTTYDLGWFPVVVSAFAASSGGELNRIGRRTIMCMVLIAVLAFVWHVLGGL
jgi:hypothetical protein